MGWQWNKIMVCAIVIVAGVAITSGAPPVRNRLSARRVIDELTAERGAQEKVESSKKRLDKLYSLTNKIETLSGDAQSVFRERITKARTDYCAATNELAKIQAKLTPERRAELEAAKKAAEVRRKADEEAMARSEKLNAEVDAFENKSEEERKRDAVERQENERQRVLKDSREKAAASERAKREAEAAKQKADREELTRKRVVAREELAGWPKGVVPSEELFVHGTNVEKVIAKCCPDTDIEVNGWRTETTVLLAPLCEKALSVVLMDNATDDRFCRRWEIGCGKSLIECDLHSDSRWKKYDDSGRLVKWAKRSEFSEYVWITNQHAVISGKLREEWAKKHGLTIEKAEARAKELIEVINTSMPRPQNGFQRNASGASVGSLRARRNQRRAEEVARMEAFNRQMKEREAAFEKRQQEEAQLRNEKKAAREAEREEQRAQLLKIQEELKRAREGKKVQQL